MRYNVNINVCVGWGRLLFTNSTQILNNNNNKPTYNWLVHLDYEVTVIELLGLHILFIYERKVRVLKTLH